MPNPDSVWPDLVQRLTPLHESEGEAAPAEPLRLPVSPSFSAQRESILAPLFDALSPSSRLVR